MFREKITMPKIGPIKWRRDGYGTQVLDFPSGGTCVHDGRGNVLGTEYPSDPIQRGYVKIWHRDVDGDPRVVDRALTVAVARRRIELLKSASSTD